MDTLVYVSNSETIQAMAAIIQGIFLIMGAIIAIFSKGGKK